MLNIDLLYKSATPMKFNRSTKPGTKMNFKNTASSVLYFGRSKNLWFDITIPSPKIQ
jgi:hypothetical protein